MLETVWVREPSPAGQLRILSERVFGVLPMATLVGNICTIGTNGITIFTICTNFFNNDTVTNFRFKPIVSTCIRFHKKVIF